MESIIKEAQEAFADAEDQESENRNRARDDLRFARLGHQWPEEVKGTRLKEKRPCLTINRLPSFIRQVTNDARQNKPSVKVHPVDDNADVATAKVINGLIRNIEYTSNADVAYDTAIEYAASMGFGYWRINIDHAYEDSFDLDICIDRVANPFTVYGDPYSNSADSSDWNTAFITEKHKWEEFARMYPNAEKATWAASYDDDKGWADDKQIRVAEYWKREEVQKKLLLLNDGKVLEEKAYLKEKDTFDAAGLQPVRERDAKGYKVKQHILTAYEVLEEVDWPGIYIPIVPVYGEEINVEGERIFLSLIHQAKDAQRMFNYWRTASTELVALAPKAPFVGPKGAFKSDAAKWKNVNTVSYPYLEFDGHVRPERQPFAGIPAGALQEAMNASDDMKSIMGLFDASLGAKSNETSGRAILARQREGDTSTFHFIDNLNRAIRHTGRILIDLIPHVYNTERVIRVIGQDGSQEAVPVNQQVQKPDGSIEIFDLTNGKYDLVVDTGPSYNTRREEAAVQMVEFIRAYPQAAPYVGDLLAKNFDWPGAEEIAERLKGLMQAQFGPKDPMQDPTVQLKMQEMQQKIMQGEQERQVEYARIAADLEKQRINNQADMQQIVAKAYLDGQRGAQDLQLKHVLEKHRIEQQENYDPVGKYEEQDEEGNPKQHPLMGLVQVVVESNKNAQDAMNGVAMALAALAEAQSRPKRIVADAQGNPVGVEPV